MSLRLRVFVLVMAALLPAVAVQLFTELSHRRAGEDGVRRQAAHEALVLSVELGRFVEGVEHVLKTLARSPVVRDGDVAACTAYVKDLRLEFNGPGRIDVADRSGRLRCPPAPGPAGNVAQRRDFQEAVRTGEFAVGFYAAENGAAAKAISFAYPLEDRDGQLSGVAMIPVDLDWLAGELQHRSLPRNSSVTVADRNGTILVRLPERQRVGDKLPPAWQQLMTADKPGASEMVGPLDGSERLVGYVPLGQGPPGLFIAVGLSTDEIMGPVDRATATALLLLLLSIVLALALSWFVSERLVHRPLAELTRTARELRRGHFDARADLAPSDATEFGGLGNTFNELAETLQAAEIERANADEKLRHARDEAEAASRSKTHFLAAVSHDLRQPLHSMTLTTDLLRIRLENRPEAELAARLKRSVANLSDLVNAVLDVSQLDAGMIVPHFDDFGLDKLLQGATDEFEDEADRKSVELRVKISSAWVRSDLRLLRRIVHNLVSNAVKYTAPGGSVQVACTEHEDRIELHVSDTGCGIPADKHAEVWEEFRQIGNPERDSSKGLGLGLSIVRRMADLLGHPVELVSEPDKGTTVTVVLPRTQPQLAASGLGALPSLAGMAMLVEDDASVAMSTAALLREWGLEVRVFRSAESALAAIGRATQPFDVLLTDYRLPTLSGLDVLRLARERWPGLLAIVMTGDVGANVKSLVPGDVTVLAKPVGAHALADALAPLAALRPVA